MQVEKDIAVARDFIEGNVYEKTGYRKVKLFSDQSLKSFKKVKLKGKNIICKINSSDEIFDILSYGGNVTAFSDNRFDEYFMKLKIASLNLSRKEYFSYFMINHGKYSYTFNYDIYKSIRNDLNIVPIRGNVGTRLEKMKNENMDGIILAAAGLKRLGMEDIITEYLNPEIFVPAVSQGALGIECLKNGEYNDYFKSLDNKDVRVTVEAERSFMRELNGGCHSLIGAYATLEGNDLYIIGTYEVNGVIVKKDILGNKEDNIELGKKLAQKILMG